MRRTGFWASFEPSEWRHHDGSAKYVVWLVLAILLAGPGCAGALPHPPDSEGWARPHSFQDPMSASREAPFALRAFDLKGRGSGVGLGISYGPHRDGQYPGGPGPSKDELREDLALITRSWDALRVYGSDGPAEEILELIEEEGLPLEVMLGAWIAAEESTTDDGQIRDLPEARAANRREIEAAVRLTRRYPEIVTAVCVGNETQVFWSAHRSSRDRLIEYVREVRARVDHPVTVADDFNFWNKPESREVARELDFIVLHAHPMWNGLRLDEALGWTRRIYEEIQEIHSDRPVVLGETGWATRRHDEGEQARLIQGRAGESEQQAFYEQFVEWVREKDVPTFYFEAFDENWKGGTHPDEVEKHWGLYRADRTPKKVMNRE